MKKVCKLNKEQDKFWINSFEYYTDRYGYGEKGCTKADEIAFKDLVKKYPELKNCKYIK